MQKTLAVIIVFASLEMVSAYISELLIATSHVGKLRLSSEYV